MSETRCTCGSGHRTFGECLRAKGIQFVDIGAHERNAALDNNLADYRKARRNGLQPASTRQRDIDVAWSISDRTGVPFRADAI